ncbi:TMEM175 family protein [Deinococcus marmoris]|uniref:Integral membrane protein n=1 Tax=Deinococcus marmoris TaxID=249408 RepID=A0A1U7P1X2_9DEIO|nr:TMEM175 family protein [Deinococcus marmoris]OLV19172.1 Integral membrane protein [Deinococcus marmoris]
MAEPLLSEFRETTLPLGTSPAERLKTFTDAVVAIALTLLILPLLETVPDTIRANETAAQWVHASSNYLLSFLLSFVLITAFWHNHERIFEHVQRQTAPLRLVNSFWMLTIVFLPVPTALLGLQKTDATQYALYLGTMLLSSLAINGLALLVARDPRIVGRNPPLPARTLASTFSATVLYALTLILALNGVGYKAAFTLMLIPVLTPAMLRVVQRLKLISSP